MNVRRIALVAGTVGLLALGGTACAAGAETVPAPGPVAVSQPAAGQAPAPSAPAAPGDTISGERAGEIALATVGGGTIHEIERDSDDDRREWEVDVRLDGVEHDLHIDAVTGEVREHDVDDRDDDDDDHRVGTPQGDDDRWDD